MADALMFGHKAIIELCDMQEELAEKGGKEKVPFKAPAKNPFLDQVKAEAYDRLCEAARSNPKKKGALRSCRSRQAGPRRQVLPEWRHDARRWSYSSAAQGCCLRRRSSGLPRSDDRREAPRWPYAERAAKRRLPGAGSAPRARFVGLQPAGKPSRSVPSCWARFAISRSRMPVGETSKPFMLDYNFPVLLGR